MKKSKNEDMQDSNYSIVIIIIMTAAAPILALLYILSVCMGVN